MDAIKPVFNLKIRVPVTALLRFCSMTWLRLFCLCLLCPLFGCDGKSETEKKVGRVASQISDEFADQTNKLGKLIPSSDEIKKSSNEEIERAFAIEYRVVEVKTDLTADQTQSLLAELGKERWDCNLMIAKAESSRLLCKRRPLSTLRTLIDAGGILW